MEHTPQVKPENAASPTTHPAEGQGTTRRPFVEPEITAPVDVLEATTFFNTSTSGPSNP